MNERNETIEKVIEALKSVGVNVTPALAPSRAVHFNKHQNFLHCFLENRGRYTEVRRFFMHGYEEAGRMLALSLAVPDETASAELRSYAEWFAKTTMSAIETLKKQFDDNDILEFQHRPDGVPAHPELVSLWRELENVPDKCFTAAGIDAMQKFVTAAKTEAGGNAA